MTPYLLTIVIPIYNREQLVKRTLESIQGQSFRPLRVILVDNGSTDNTLATLREWAHSVSTDGISVDVLSCTTPGAPAARNAGLARVDTPWVMFFDSDDIMKPWHIERIIKAIKRHRRADVIGYDITLHTPNGKTTVKPFAESNLLYNCIHKGSFATQRYVCRTDLIRDCGAWDETVYAWNDIELGTRLLIRYPDINVVKIKGNTTVDVYASYDSNSITGRSYYDRAAEREHALDLMSKYIVQYQQYIVNLKRVILAANYKREGHPDEAIRLRDHALSLTYSVWHRLLMHAAYSYTAAGGHGAARLLRPFF